MLILNYFIQQEIFNPFPTIAVWAAVKFVHKREVSQGGRMRHRYAFLPLISDPDGRDKSRLFHDLETETEVELAADAPHPPVFACVMRKQGSHSAHKQLECHGFVCNTSEDAIIIAANLYQVLKKNISFLNNLCVFLPEHLNNCFAIVLGIVRDDEETKIQARKSKAKT